MITKTKKEFRYMLSPLLLLLTPLVVMIMLEGFDNLVDLIGLWALFTIPIYLMLLFFIWSTRIEINSTKIILNALFIYKEIPLEAIASYEITKGGITFFSLASQAIALNLNNKKKIILSPQDTASFIKLLENHQIVSDNLSDKQPPIRKEIPLCLL